jgi:serine/threonine protein kinase
MGAIRIGTVIAGKYRLESPLAHGGMGSVWAARHLLLDKVVAIKFIGAEVAGLDDVRTRFAREAMAAASLQSPHVVQIHDYGIDDDVPYLVMELLEGEDLGERLARRGKLPPAEVASLVTQVARALRRAAAAGIVHRDLKPSNIFIVRGDDDDEIVKVLDFGVAKAPRLGLDESTRTGAMIGSPRYMSPEQARGSRLVDHRSDLWSLAVIAYRALTGQLPFVGDDIADLIVKICAESAIPPSQVEPSLDAEVDAFFARALARPADERFQTARELAVGFALAVGESPPMSMSSSQLPAVRLPPSRQSAPGPAAPPDTAARWSVPGPAAPPNAAARLSAPGPAVTPDAAARCVAPVEPTCRSSEAPPMSLRSAALAESLTAAEPALHRRAVPAPEGTLTSSVGSVDLPAREVARLAQRGRRLRAVAAGVLLVATVLVVRLVWSPSRHDAGPAPLAPSAANPSPAVPADRPASAPPPADRPASAVSPDDVTPALPTSGPASPSASAPPPAVIRRLAPRPRRPTKRNSILGI